MSGPGPALKQTLELVAGAGIGAIAGTFINNTIKTAFAGASAPPAWVGGGVCVAAGAAAHPRGVDTR